MIVISDLSQLPAADTCAVIINCGTKWVATFALLSATKNTNAPVLVVNCESKDGSRRHFETLSVEHKLAFHWLDWPLRPHPIALDQLFREIPASSVLLVDSDVEIRTPLLYEAMQSALAHHPDAYGAGFLHGPEWLGAEHGLRPFAGYYAERMWIPLVMLRVAVVREALAQGASFRNRRPFFEFPAHPWLSQLVSYRYRIRGLRHLQWPTPRPSANRPAFDGRCPAFVEYDTGADLHARLTSRGLPFRALPKELWSGVQHYHGVTRASLAGPFRRFAKTLHLASRDSETDQANVLEKIKRQLADVYQVDVGQLGRNPTPRSHA